MSVLWRAKRHAPGESFLGVVLRPEIQAKRANERHEAVEEAWLAWVSILRLQERIPGLALTESRHDQRLDDGDRCAWCVEAQCGPYQERVLHSCVCPYGRCVDLMSHDISRDIFNRGRERIPKSDPPALSSMWCLCGYMGRAHNENEREYQSHVFLRVFFARYSTLRDTVGYNLCKR